MGTKSRMPTNKTVLDLCSEHFRPDIDLNPKYQRNSVWKRPQKQLLVDSILRGFDIPKLYFREIENSDTIEVVDGQQRLRAIFDFWDNTLPLSKDADPVGEVKIAGRLCKDLPAAMRRDLERYSFNIVTLGLDWNQTDVENLYLRVQNGTPLTPPEKRRSMGSGRGMCMVVEHLASHPVFAKRCAFNNKRFGWEDAAAKCMSLRLSKGLVDTKPKALAKLFCENSGLTQEDASVKDIWAAYSFLDSSLTTGRIFKMAEFISLFWLSYIYLAEYDLRSYSKEFGEFIQYFHNLRAQNETKAKKDQDPELLDYKNGLRYETAQAQTSRYALLRQHLHARIPTLKPKDSKRLFSRTEKETLWWLVRGRCQRCETDCDLDACHADHIEPHSRGGITTIENGQILCGDCNRKKGNKVEVPLFAKMSS